jgi:hypothetical protein
VTPNQHTLGIFFIPAGPALFYLLIFIYLGFKISIERPLGGGFYFFLIVKDNHPNLFYIFIKNKQKCILCS